MAQDPYRTPSSAVGEREAAEDAAPRPARIGFACRILWVTVLLSVATLHPSVRGEWWLEGVPAGDEEAAGAMLVGGLVMSGLFFAVFVTALFLTGRRRNWARWLLLGLLALGWMMWLSDLSRSFAETPGAALADTLICAAELWAAYLLFLTPEAAWFRRRAGPR
jgi:hypothetical protein